MNKKVSVILPAYNESGNITVIAKRLDEVFASLPYDHELLFIDDGSSDHTMEILQAMHKDDPKLHYIELSRNFGHQNALKAGLDLADGDCIISMDCDLQHPPELIKDLLEKWEEGYEIVYTRRGDDPNLSDYKRKMSKLFYSMMNRMSDINLEPGTADFRLIDRKVATIFQNFSETEPFIRGLIKWLGFKQYGINYKPDSRFAGKSSYSTKKMFRLALQGITSFSIRPLYTAVYLGFIFSFLSILYVPYVIYSFYTGHEVVGWASVIMTIVFFGGLQLIILGIIGIYIGKLFIQSKKRPNYIIRSTSLNNN